MSRRVQCAASYRFEKEFPDDPGDPEKREEGIAAHWVVSETLTDRLVAEGQLAPNGLLVTEEMIEGADDMAAYVEPHIYATKVETPIAIPTIHPECWGTPDATQWRASAYPYGTLRVIDYKFGHRVHDPFEHWQTMAYACGELLARGIDGSNDHLAGVELVIVQPRGFVRGGPIRSWAIRADDLRPYLNIMRAAIEASERPEAPATAGPECEYCPARLACPEAQRWAAVLIDSMKAPELLTLTTAQAAAELEHLRHAIEIAQARASGLESQLLSAGRLGQPVPRFHIEPGSGREVWAVPVAQVVELGRLFGQDLTKPPAVITPVQARARGVDVPGFSTIPQGALKLVPDGDSLRRVGFGKVRP